MNKGRWCFGFLILIFLFSSSLIAQADKAPPVSTVFAALSRPLESKSAVVGDGVILQTISNVVVDREVVIPKGSRLLGHVAGVITKGANERQSILAIVIDKAILVGKVELPLQAIVVAIAAPQNSLASDPTYEMMHSNEPKMSGPGPRGAAGSGGLSASSKVNSNAAVATAEIKGRMDESLMLTEDSQGAIGYEGVLISWQLTLPPPLTVFRSKAKNIKLEAGTQMLLRMVPPRLAH